MVASTFVTLRGVLLLLLARDILGGIIIKGCDRLSVLFPPRNLWSPETWALKDLSAEFNGGITSFIGASSSGKSTLLKLIVNNNEDIIKSSSYMKKSGKFNYVNETHECLYSRQYIGPLFYLHVDYDNSKSCNALFLKHGSPRNEQMLQKVLQLGGLPINSKVSSLLESERRIFEISLAMSRLLGEGPSPVLVLDEYLDKDVLEVKKKIGKFLRSMCADPEINLQVFIATHSESVMRECSDWTIVLNRGRLFHQGPPQSVRKPLQLATSMLY